MCIGASCESFAEVDRSKSNLNACVVRVPAYKEELIEQNVTVHIEVFISVHAINKS